MKHFEYYGLKLDPFSNTPDNRFYFNSDQHAAALAKIVYIAKSMKGLAVLIGDVGTGKTTLARKLLQSLPEDKYEASMLVIIHSGITADWLLTKIAVQLGVENPASEKIKLLGQLYHRLVEIHDGGKTAIILVDEAQMLKDREIMEEFRGLLNLELPGKKFISFVLFGLPDLEENLKQDEPLNQRVALRYRLGYLNLESIENYIKHRLRVAGGNKMLFTKEAVKSIQIFTRGIPRLINNLCDNVLLEGMLLKLERIDRSIIEKIAHDLNMSAASEQEIKKIEEQKVTPVSVPLDAESEPATTPLESKAQEAGISSFQEKEKKSHHEEVDIDKLLDSLEVK